MKVIDWFCSFLPKMGNKKIIGFYELLRKLHRVPLKKIEGRLHRNQEVFSRHIGRIKEHCGYIEDQNSYTDMQYGKVTMQYAGCEVFSVYNALNNLYSETKTDLCKLISEFEKDGCVLSGRFGTAPKAIADYLNRLGLQTVFSVDESEFNEIGVNSDSLILTMYNDRNDIRKEIHTVNISKEGLKYTAHNVYCNGVVVGPYGSVLEIIENINSGKAKGISLIGIRRNKNE